MTLDNLKERRGSFHWMDDNKPVGKLGQAETK